MEPTNAPLSEDRAMKQLATIGALALGCLGCAAGPTNEDFGASFNYNALTCTQLQEEAARWSFEAAAMIGSPDRKALRADPSAVLLVPWPDLSGSRSPEAGRLKARMEAIERTSRGKSCAIRVQRPAGAAP